MNCEEKFLKYDKERDTVYVFGAGASIADGCMLQKDILPSLLKTISSDSRIVISSLNFIKDNFSTEGECYPSLESVFGYLDYFISRNESLGEKYNTLNLIEIRECLVKLIHHTLSKYNKSKGVYKKFWQMVEQAGKNVSIITLNYDTLLDEAFDFLYPESAIIDYCTNLMNYENYDGLDGFNWWDNPREPVGVWEGIEKKAIKLIKLHGSLNWKYCNCCNQVYLTPWDIKIDLDSLGFKGRIGASCDNPQEVIYDLVCPIDNTGFNSLIVPPSHIKDLSHPTVNRLLDEAAIEIRKAKKIVFIGYSFPEADVHIKALFKKNMRKGTSIEIVNPYITEQTKNTFLSLSKDVVFVENFFENYIETFL
jgi:hypothetical protein